MPRRADKITVEANGGSFDRFEALEIVNDIDGVAEAILEFGDDGAYPELVDIIGPGEELRVYLNGQLRLTGRAEINEIPGTADEGIRIRISVRTKLADARVSSANPAIAVRNTTIRKAIVQAFEPFGLDDKPKPGKPTGDFVFGEFVDVELMTGRGPKGRVDIDLDPINVLQAKVQPPETVYEFLERHLSRYRATLWDAPDGRIIVGRPDDLQPPSYRLQAKRSAAARRSNNLIGFSWVRDWSDIPKEVRVYGHTWGRDVTKSHFRGVAEDSDVAAIAARTGHFNRSVIVHDQTSKDRQRAQDAARRELVKRIRRKDAIELETDGWSFWDGARQIPYANNTTVNVDIDPLGGDLGSYLVAGVALRLTLGGGATTRLLTLAPGVWQL